MSCWPRAFFYEVLNSHQQKGPRLFTLLFWEAPINFNFLVLREFGKVQIKLQLFWIWVAYDCSLLISVNKKPMPIWLLYWYDYFFSFQKSFWISPNSKATEVDCKTTSHFQKYFDKHQANDLSCQRSFRAKPVTVFSQMLLQMFPCFLSSKITYLWSAV